MKRRIPADWGNLGPPGGPRLASLSGVCIADPFLGLTAATHTQLSQGRRRVVCGCLEGDSELGQKRNI
jgi:hypothetical protein